MVHEEHSCSIFLRLYIKSIILWNTEKNGRNREAVHLKVYIQPKGITLVGKGWQIKHMLKQYASRYQTVEEWISSSQPKVKPSLKVLP
jgi:hypothetical protein